MEEEKSFKIRLECKVCHIPNDYETGNALWTEDYASYPYFACLNCNNRVIAGDKPTYIWDVLKLLGKEIEAINPKKETTDWEMIGVVLGLFLGGLLICLLVIKEILPSFIEATTNSLGMESFIFGAAGGFLFHDIFFTRRGRFRW